MLPPLRTLLVALWVSSIAGAVVILRLSMGDYSVQAFAIAAAVGLILGVPAAMANWAMLRPRRAREVGLIRD